MCDNWKITEEHKKTMSAFMTDFWDLIKASYEMPPEDDQAEGDHYWSTLVKWADAMGTKYNADRVIMGIILGYLDGQSNRSNGFDVTFDTDNNS